MEVLRTVALTSSITASDTRLTYYAADETRTTAIKMQCLPLLVVSAEFTFLITLVHTLRAALLFNHGTDP